jgi:hypothetical protein
VPSGRPVRPADWTPSQIGRQNGAVNLELRQFADVDGFLAIAGDFLDAGRRFCFLFTDLANPTANHIYQAIGYEPVRDLDEYRFELS